MQVASGIIRRVFSHTTMSFSNVVGPLEEISCFGHPLSYIAPSTYGHPHVCIYINMCPSLSMI